MDLLRQVTFGASCKMENPRIEIRVNQKMYLLRGGLFALLAVVGVWIFLSYAYEQTWLTPWVVQVMAGVIVFIFGVLATNDLQKGLGDPVGLVITPEGFIDHASNLGLGLVRWKEIRQMRIDDARSEHHILIELVKPDQATRKSKNPLQQNLLQTNVKLYGTPVVIHADHLLIKPAALLELLLERHSPPQKRK